MAPGALGLASGAAFADRCGVPQQPAARAGADGALADRGTRGLRAPERSPSGPGPELSGAGWRAFLVEAGVGMGLPLAVGVATVLLSGARSHWANVVVRALLWSVLGTLGGLQVWQLQSLAPVTAPATLGLELVDVGVGVIACVGCLVLVTRGKPVPPSRAETCGPYEQLLTTSVVMGLADAMTLGGVVLLSAMAHGGLTSHHGLALGLACGLVTACVGQQQRRLWGLLAMTGTNVAEFLAVPAGVLDGFGPFAVLVCATSVVQLCIPYPVYQAVLGARRGTALFAKLLNRGRAGVLMLILVSTAANLFRGVHVYGLWGPW